MNWSIDGNATLQEALDDAGCPVLLRRMLAATSTWQMRNETAVCRALVAPRLATRWVAALLALGATAVMEGDDGPQEVGLEALLQREANGRVSILRVTADGVLWGEASVARTPADVPIVAAVAAVAMDGGAARWARVALAGVWPEPVRLAEAPAGLVGGPLDAESIKAVAAAVEQEVAPGGDYLGSVEYRRAMAGVLARRALEACARQGVGDG
jgi:CO/xanthine dehydrogenase FAD-binding subunit